MRKKLLLFIIAAIFTFSSMTVLAAEDTADKDAKDKKSAAATIDTSLYYYNNFDNDAYRGGMIFAFTKGLQTRKINCNISTARYCIIDNVRYR